MFGWFGLAALLVSGFFALRAIIRDHDRAISLLAVVILVLWFLVSVPLILLAGGEA